MRRRDVIAGLGLLMVLLAGCGSAAPPLTRSSLVSAIGRTRALRSFRYRANLLVISPSGDTTVAISAVADLHAGEGTTTVRSAGNTERAIFAGHTVWTSFTAPAFTSLLPAGRVWVTASESQLEALGAFHPLADSLAVLDALRGVETLHRTGAGRANFTFSLARALQATPPGGRVALQDAIHANGPGLVETGTVSVSGGTIRALNLLIDGSGQTAGLRLRYFVTLTDPGVAVHVTPPPAGTVVALGAVPKVTQLLTHGAHTG